VYIRNTPWSAEQESIINSFFESLIDGEMYALDWEHDCSEWKYGLFGHPWRCEFVVIGQELIDMFEANKQNLGI